MTGGVVVPFAPLSRRTYGWRQVSWSPDPILTVGEVGGLPAVTWGWADRAQLATTRQLRALGLRRGGQDPVAVLVFRHRKPYRRTDHAWLYLISAAVPKRTATAAQLAALGRALDARKTCPRCGVIAQRCIPRDSRLCPGCEERTGYWADHAREHGWATTESEAA